MTQEGEKYNFQKGWGINITFGSKYRPKDRDEKKIQIHIQKKFKILAMFNSVIPSNLENHDFYDHNVLDNYDIPDIITLMSMVLCCHR